MPERDPIPDEELMARVAAGDDGAFEALLHRHAGRVHRYAFGILRDDAAAEDAVQQTFLRLLQSSSTWKPTGRFTGYLLKIARNLCLNELARRRPSEEFRPDAPSAAAGPASIAEGREEAARVRAALEHLSPKDREILWLRVWEKLPYKEIAGITGIQEDSARSRMRNALNALGIELGKDRQKP